MANVVIVTRQCYLLCEAINFIAINEIEDDRKEDYSIFSTRRRRKRKVTKKQREAANLKQFQIVIDFIPVAGVNGNHLRKQGQNPDSTSVAITVTGYDRCLALFGDMVDQIREQIPDSLFLNKLVEKFMQENAPEDEK